MRGTPEHVARSVPLVQADQGFIHVEFDHPPALACRLLLQKVGPLPENLGLGRGTRMGPQRTSKRDQNEARKGGPEKRAIGAPTLRKRNLDGSQESRKRRPKESQNPTPLYPESRPQKGTQRGTPFQAFSRKTSTVSTSVDHPPPPSYTHTPPPPPPHTPPPPPTLKPSLNARGCKRS